MFEVETRKLDLVILDFGLPDNNGLDLIRKLRNLSDVSVIVLSARTRESDKIAALDLGADDCLTQQFGVGELLAQVRTARRPNPSIKAADPPSGSGM